MKSLLHRASFICIMFVLALALTNSEFLRAAPPQQNQGAVQGPVGFVVLDLTNAQGITISGWAADPRLGTGNGPGVDQVWIVIGEDCNAERIGESLLTRSRPDVVTYLRMDNSYLVTGFDIPIPDFPIGQNLYSACAHSLMTGESSIVDQLEITATAEGLVFAHQTKASITFRAIRQTDSNDRLEGWAVDSRGGLNNGPGITEVRAFEGTQCGTGNVLGSAMLTQERRDVVEYLNLDDSYLVSGFRIELTPPRPGIYMAAVCGFSSVTQDWVLLRRQAYAIKSILGFVDAFPYATERQMNRVTGWVVDRAAGPNAGPGIQLVQVHLGSTCTGELVGIRDLTVNRPDVPPYLGFDESYTLSGFDIEVTLPDQDQVTLTVCAMSSNSGSLFPIETKTISIP